MEIAIDQRAAPRNDATRADRKPSSNTVGAWPVEKRTMDIHLGVFVDHHAAAATDEISSVEREPAIDPQNGRVLPRHKTHRIDSHPCEPRHHDILHAADRRAWTAHEVFAACPHPGVTRGHAQLGYASIPTDLAESLHGGPSKGINRR